MPRRLRGEPCRAAQGHELPGGEVMLKSVRVRGVDCPVVDEQVIRGYAIAIAPDGENFVVGVIMGGPSAVGFVSTAWNPEDVAKAVKRALDHAGLQEG
jgi:hypothetical protein